MTGWAAVAIVAIVVWGIVQLSRSRDRTQRRDDGATESRETREIREKAQREIAALHERIAVLERIATDGNSPAARETKRISDQIEALRDKQDGSDPE